MTEFDDVAAFPLCWPDGWPRTAQKMNSRFKVGTVYSAVSGLTESLRLMDAEGVIISTSIPLRRDGLPLSKPPVDGDHGAAVYFVRNGKPLCLACDQYWDVADNIHALAKTIEAIRGIERWGSTDLLDRVFTGFAALPSGGSWFDGLKTAAEIRARYRELAKTHHPDAGGDASEFSRITDAYNRALEVANA